MKFGGHLSEDLILRPKDFDFDGHNSARFALVLKELFSLRGRPGQNLIECPKSNNDRRGNERSRDDDHFVTWNN
jgi:hypothetical protein